MHTSQKTWRLLSIDKEISSSFRRFGKRVLPLSAVAPAYYGDGGDAEEEAELLEELLAEAGLE